MNAITYMMFLMLAAVAAVPKEAALAKQVKLLRKLDKAVKLLGVQEDRFPGHFSCQCCCCEELCDICC